MTKFLSGLLILIILFSCKGTNSNELNTNVIDSLNNQISLKDIEIDSLSDKLKKYELSFRSMVFSSSSDFEYLDSESEDDPYGHIYRVEIYLSEIYKSLYITHILFYGEGVQKIDYQTKIDLENEFDINSEETNSLTFIKWITPDEFEIQIKDNLYNVSIINENTIDIKQS